MQLNMVDILLCILLMLIFCICTLNFSLSLIYLVKCYFFANLFYIYRLLFRSWLLNIFYIEEKFKMWNAVEYEAGGNSVTWFSWCTFQFFKMTAFWFVIWTLRLTNAYFYLLSKRLFEEINLCCTSQDFIMMVFSFLHGFGFSVNIKGKISLHVLPRLKPYNSLKKGLKPYMLLSIINF